MTEQKRKQSNRLCRCDHVAPKLRILRSPEFNQDLAVFYCNQTKSGDGIVDMVLSEVYVYHAGSLSGPDEATIPVGSDAKRFDRLFGQDERRFINRYREKATRLPRNRLDHRCVFAVTILHLARQIRLCRTQGRCSK